ncbi:MAG: putative toxin-antitoxin system toxin component, PIN family [Bryobacterales bacterium]|nr:putative toxin-antitoxin system toxin component, PIN family [Bryobacterales bacterium]
MRVVLDTNILISALITSVSPSAQVLALWRSRKFELLTCAQQLEEFARATRYPQVRARLVPALAGALLNRVRDRALVLENLPTLDLAPDPDDNYLLALAEAGEAQFLVTGDKPLLGLKRHKSIRLVTPAALLELLKERNK